MFHYSQKYKKEFIMFKDKTVSFAIYTYIALPFIIFAAGFLKWYFALPFTIAIVASLFLAAKSAGTAYSDIKIDRYDQFKMLVGFIAIVIVVIAAGIGNILWQNPDHATRNTLFNALVTNTWPPKAAPSGDVVSIVYYIGFWLPAALVGKLAGLQAGYVFQIVWAAVGIFILWYLLCLMHKKVVIYPIVIFLLFSGLDTVGLSIVEAVTDSLNTMQKGMWAYPAGSPSSSHLEWWASRYQYSSHITQLFWVFNQCLPVWLATIVLLLEKNNKNLVFIMGLTLLSSTLPFIGLIPVFVWCAVTKKDNVDSILDRPLTKTPKKDFVSLFTFQNVIGGGISGIISFLYLKGNIATSAASSASTTTKATAEVFSIPVFLLVIVLWAAAFVLLSDLKTLKPTSALYFIPSIPLAFLAAKISSYPVGLYVLFIVFEVLIIALVALPAYRKSTLLFVTVSCLLIIPFFKVGRSIDFCMRASIPLLVVLCLFVIGAFGKYLSEKKFYLLAPVVVVLALGAVTPIHEITRTAEASMVQIQKDYTVENPSISYTKLFKGKNFTGKVEDNVFFEVFAK